MTIAVCMKCGTILESKHRHDCVFCGCENNSMLDGGDTWVRRGGKDLGLVRTCLSMSEARRLSSHRTGVEP